MQNYSRARETNNRYSCFERSAISTPGTGNGQAYSRLNTNLFHVRDEVYGHVKEVLPPILENLLRENSVMEGGFQCNSNENVLRNEESPGERENHSESSA